MARKRGGLAGIWDRNKKIIKPLVEVGATFLAGGNPLAGAAAGAAMEGFDRPGKGGVGFDVGRGAVGGLKGYGAGQLGNVAQAGLSNLFTAQAAPAAAQATVPSNIPTTKNFLGMSAKDWLSIIGQGGIGALNYGQQQNRAKLDQRELEERIRQFNLEEARRAREEALRNQDRERLLGIASEREKELAPVRDMLAQAILGGQNKLFGGSITQGMVRPGTRYL